MPPKSKHKHLQDLLFSHFNGGRHRAVCAVLIYLKHYDMITYNLLLDRFKNMYTFSQLSNKYGYDVRYIQRMFDKRIYSKLNEYLHVLQSLVKF